MAKTKTQQKSAPVVQKGVKEGRVTKPLQSAKAKSKDIAKAAANKLPAKKPVAEESSSEEEESDDDSDVSESGSDSSSDDSESDASDDSVGKKVVPNGAKPVNGANGAHDSDDSSDDDSSEDESDEETGGVALKGKAPKTNGATKAGADEDESDSFHSAADEKPAAKFEADSDADSDEDSSSEDDDEAAPVKANGVAKDEDSEEDSEDDSEDDDESDEEPAPKKRKAEAEVEAPTKKAKVAAVDDEAQTGPNGESTNLFVGRISWATDDDALYHEFSSFGEIVGCRVVYDRDSGKSKGFGYVQFAKLSEAIAAKEAKHEALVDGRNINVDYSQPRSDKPREPQNDRAKRFGDVQGAPADTLFVGNLSFDATYDLVRETFEQYGDIKRISLPTDRESGQMKGFGYVSYGSVDEAKAALEALSGAEIAGRTMRLDYATARADGAGGDRGGRGGRGRGGDRGGRGFGGGRGGGGRGGGFRGGRGGDRGGRGGGFSRGSSTNRGGFGDFQGKKISF